MLNRIFGMAKKEKSQTSDKMKWKTLYKSVKGATHILKKLPNQDFCLAIYDEKNAVYKSVVSDGHGSNKSFRSDKGSKIAGVKGLEAVDNFFKILTETPQDKRNVKRLIQESIPKYVTRCWREAVIRDAKTHPLDDKEKTQYLEAYGEDFEEDFDESSFPYTIYGATLTIALVTQSFISYIKIGDGDIVEVRTAEGEQREDLICSTPFTKSIDDIGDDVDSLCQKNAVDNFLVHYQPFDETVPLLIMLSTDGYSNSYTDDEGFHKNALDYVSYLREYSQDVIEKSLEDWLTEISQGGSGDDISVVLLKREEPTDFSRREKKGKAG